MIGLHLTLHLTLLGCVCGCRLTNVEVVKAQSVYSALLQPSKDQKQEPEHVIVKFTQR